MAKTLQIMATKLDVSEDERVLSKAAEFERLLQTKLSNSNLPDTGKAVICLDLASTFYGNSIDLKTAIKYSGLKSTMYTNNKKTIENILELNKDSLSVPVLCLSLQCTPVQELAQKILDQYRKMAKMDIDVMLPQYICMAVYQACRINKVKVTKSKLIEKSRLKPAQWSKFDAEWSKFVDENFAVAKKVCGTKKTEITETTEEKMEIDIPKKDDVEPQIEIYDDWKQRILKNAYKQLEQDSKTKAVDKKERKNLKYIDDVDMCDKDRYTNTKDKTEKKHKSNNDKLHEKDGYTISPKERKEKKHEKVVSDIEMQEKDGYTKDIRGKERGVKLVLTPRKSPRKTPQKFEPYTPPNKGKGVRLLFAK